MLELGVQPGQVWSLRDYLRTIPWGRFRSAQRLAYSIAESYELSRSGQHQPAAAQSLQTIKAIVFSTLNAGNMGMAQVLTGMPDPCAGPVGLAEADEIALMTNYMEAQSAMAKQVATAATTAPAGLADIGGLDSSEEAPPVASRRQKAKAAKEKRAGEAAPAGPN
jgi:hypothetical protein